MKGNRSNHPKKYVHWDDWQSWILKEWTPFMQNDLPHLKNDMKWVKWLLGVVIISIIGAALAILSQR